MNLQSLRYGHDNACVLGAHSVPQSVCLVCYTCDCTRPSQPREEGAFAVIPILQVGERRLNYLPKATQLEFEPGQPYSEATQCLTPSLGKGGQTG